ncbi:MAG: hypothetical protein PUA62_10020 [Lachnospiraceae bacterium]|nr:hypothetical protein [Lachnospiraceae bacterium]
MKFAHKLDDILTVFYIVLFLVAILLVAICCSGGNLFFDEAGNSLDSMPSDDSAAGIEALGHLVAAGFAGMTGLAMFIASVMWGSIALILLVTIWRAWSRRKLFKSTGDIACLRKNISTKLIYNTLCLVLVIWVLIWDANVGFGIAGVLLCVMEVLVVRARMLIQSQGE